ncbi:serine hydrolase domain-containing protein [Microbacterium sp. A196]|uniref:serine hydrolase domain-containing protein n=1 Tax=Microbacterium sp. A196 TaxID=3457320 RepID=UPI003FD1EE16
MTGADAALSSRLGAALAQAVEACVTPGAVCQVTIAGETVTATAGDLASHDDAGAPIPLDQRTPVSSETVYDLASVSKVFTSIALLSLADEGIVDIDASVGEWLPSFRNGVRSDVTLAHLLSHTAGLPPVNPFTIQHAVQGFGTDDPRWVTPGRSALLDGILSLPLDRAPGTDKVYSCLGYITSMAAAEAATGASWSQIVRERVLAPLGLERTTLTPDAARTAPTEFQPELGRGMIRGVVHDETACALGGAAGNAGLFAPVADLTALGSALLAGLPDVLRPEFAALLWEDQLPRLIGPNAAAVEHNLGYGQSLGLRIGQRTWMSDAGTGARGHTGFVGTSLLVDREHDLVVALLTNRVHPNRSLADATDLRHAISTIAYGH